MASKEQKAFSTLYHEVFNEAGEIQLVRRDKCRQLIQAAKAVTPIYGDEETGWMKPDSIKALYAELFPNGETDDE